MPRSTSTLPVDDVFAKTSLWPPSGTRRCGVGSAGAATALHCSSPYAGTSHMLPRFLLPILDLCPLFAQLRAEPTSSKRWEELVFFINMVEGGTLRAPSSNFRRTCFRSARYSWAWDPFNDLYIHKPKSESPNQMTALAHVINVEA